MCMAFAAAAIAVGPASVITAWSPVHANDTA
jgi:hypothetical protein